MATNKDPTGLSPRTFRTRLHWWLYGGAFVTESEDANGGKTITFHTRRPIWFIRLWRFFRDDPKWAIPTILAAIAAIAAVAALVKD